jgi:hypothetical protein
MNTLRPHSFGKAVSGYNTAPQHGIYAAKSGHPNIGLNDGCVDKDETALAVLAFAAGDAG